MISFDCSNNKKTMQTVRILIHNRVDWDCEGQVDNTVTTGTTFSFLSDSVSPLDSTVLFDPLRLFHRVTLIHKCICFALIAAA